MQGGKHGAGRQSSTAGTGVSRGAVQRELLDCWKHYHEVHPPGLRPGGRGRGQPRTCRGLQSANQPASQPAMGRAGASAVLVLPLPPWLQPLCRGVRAQVRLPRSSSGARTLFSFTKVSRAAFSSGCSPVPTCCPAPTRPPNEPTAFDQGAGALGTSSEGRQGGGPCGPPARAGAWGGSHAGHPMPSATLGITLPCHWRPPPNRRAPDGAWASALQKLGLAGLLTGERRCLIAAGRVLAADRDGRVTRTELHVACNMVLAGCRLIALGTTRCTLGMAQSSVKPVRQGQLSRLGGSGHPPSIRRSSPAQPAALLANRRT